MLQVIVQGRESLSAELPAIPKKMQSSVLLQMSQIAYDTAQRGAGSHSRSGGSGALFQSLYNRSIPNGREVGHDTDRAPHAGFVLLGARAHKIRPKNKKALRWPSGGVFRFAREVNHPGYRGDNYLNRAADDALRQFAAIVDRATKEAA